MISVEQARKIAQKETGFEFGAGAVDDGEYYIFGYIEEVALSPTAVNKETGEVVAYFPPAHPRYLKAKRLN